MLTLRDHWKTGQVTRYHANPPLNRILQTTADHSAGMLILLFELNPQPSVDLVQAIVNHDRGEYWVGDTPGPAKRRFERLSNALDWAEAEVLREAGIKTPFLTDTEQVWLKVLDLMESALFMAFHGRAWTTFQIQQRIVEPLAELGVTVYPEDFQ